MFKTYFLTAFRSAAKSKLAYILGNVGLTIGLVAALLILYFFANEHSYDDWLKNSDNIYRVDTTESFPGRVPQTFARAPGPARDALINEISGIKNATRGFVGDIQLELDGQQVEEASLVIDRNFFDLLKLPVLIGDVRSTQLNSSNIVITETIARKYFGSHDVIGRTLTVYRGTARDYVIRAVIKDLPQNSHMSFDVLIPIDGYFTEAETNNILNFWGGAYFHTYIELEQGINPHNIEQDLPDLIDRNMPASLARILSTPPHDFLRFDLVQLSDIHFHGAKLATMKQSGNWIAVHTIGIVAVLIILISGFNFSILATARITARAKEVAVRKVFGAKQSEVMLQFFAETFGQTLVAGLLAAGLSDLIIPIVETWFGPVFGNGLWGNLKFIGWLFLLILITAFVSGFYPSFILGRLKPVTIFTSLLTNASKIESLRLTMVAIQIAVTACLIVVSTSMLSQYRFLDGQDLGFSPDGLVVLKVPDVPDQTRLVQSLYTRLRSLPSIDYLSVSSTVPGEPTEANLSVILPDQTKPIQIGFHMVSDTFFETYGVRQIAGMLFSEEFGKGVTINLDEEGSSLPVVVNASAVKLLGLTDAHKAIGQSIKTTGGVIYQIFGVIPDMRFRSLKEKARPELFILSDKPGAMLTVKQRGGDDTTVMDELETALQMVLPEHVVEVQFIQSLIDRYYESDRQNINVIISFSVMAILLSSIGFIATIHYAIDRQRRELAIRRIYGAQIMDLLMIFIKKLLKPVLAANAIAFLMSYYLVVAWLERFEKQWAIDIYPFLSATFIVLILTAGLLLIHVKVISRIHPSIVLHRE